MGHDTGWQEMGKQDWRVDSLSLRRVRASPSRVPQQEKKKPETNISSFPDLESPPIVKPPLRRRKRPSRHTLTPPHPTVLSSSSKAPYVLLRPVVGVSASGYMIHAMYTQTYTPYTPYIPAASSGFNLSCVNITFLTPDQRHRSWPE